MNKYFKAVINVTGFVLFLVALVSIIQYGLYGRTIWAPIDHWSRALIVFMLHVVLLLAPAIALSLTEEDSAAGVPQTIECGIMSPLRVEEWRDAVFLYFDAEPEDTKHFSSPYEFLAAQVNKLTAEAYSTGKSLGIDIGVKQASS